VKNVHVNRQLNRQLDRWTGWAQSLTARHERFTTRRGPLLMTLLEPLRLSLAVTQRRESFALSVFPRIQFSIGPILQQIAPAQFQTFVQHSSLRAEDRREWSSLKVSVQSNNAVSLRNSTRTVHNLAEFNSVVQAHQELKKFSQSAVARFFSRVERSHHGVVSLRQLLVEHDSRTIAERVVREHSRVEQRRGSDIVIREQNRPAAAAVQERTSVALEQQLATARTHSHSWPDKPAEINVDQLTEQVIRKIDHRIMAYRERLGRAF